MSPSDTPPDYKKMWLQCKRQYNDLRRILGDQLSAAQTANAELRDELHAARKAALDAREQLLLLKK